MDEKIFDPELNEELFDLVDSAMEEEFEKLGMPKRMRYELLNSINKNLESKFANTRVVINHIVQGKEKIKEDKGIDFSKVQQPMVQAIHKDGLKEVPLSKETSDKIKYYEKLKNNIMPVNMDEIHPESTTFEPAEVIERTDSQQQDYAYNEFANRIATELKPLYSSSESLNDMNEGPKTM